MSVQDLKEKINSLVTTKVALTRERTAYKYQTRATLSQKEGSDWQKFENERSRYFWSIDYKRWDLKEEIRHHLLAYGFIRNVPYKNIERKCGEDNHPSFRKISDIASTYSDRGFTQAMVEDWLSGESLAKPIPQETAAVAEMGA